MIHNQRILWNDDGTEIDLSVALSNYRGDSVNIPLVAVDDAIYIATDLPFNHKYILMQSTKENSDTSAITADIWFGNEWNEVKDVIDRTSVGGATLAQSGVFEVRPDRLKGWDRELDSEDVDGVDKVGIYNMYWMRLTFTGDLHADTAIQYIGYKFSDDDQLAGHYPDTAKSGMKLAFASGKVDWIEQHCMAGEEIIADLRRQNIIRTPNQIINYELFQLASIHKTAEIIYRGLGNPYLSQKKDAAKEYEKAIALTFHDIDRNANASLDDYETIHSTVFGTR